MRKVAALLKKKEEGGSGSHEGGGESGGAAAVERRGRREGSQRSLHRLHASAAWRKRKATAQMGKGDAAVPEHNGSPCAASVPELE